MDFYRTCSGTHITWPDFTAIQGNLSLDVVTTGAQIYKKIMLKQSIAAAIRFTLKKWLSP
jgi:hypothetical protein